MANPGYVIHSAVGDGTGSSFTNANVSLANAIVDAVAGDRIWSADGHSESTAGVLLLAFPGTTAAPNQVYCGDDAAEPPTALANTAVIANTGNAAIRVSGSFYMHGHDFQCGVSGGGTSSAIELAYATGPARQVYDDCKFRLLVNSGVLKIHVASIATGNETNDVVWRNSSPQFAHATQNIQLYGANFNWIGGSMLGTAITGGIFVLGSASRAGNYFVSGVDFSNIGTACHIINASASSPNGSFRFIATGIILPSGWTGTPSSLALSDPGQRIELRKYMVGSTENLLWIRDHFGDITGETVVKRTTGGSADGATGYSFKMDTTKSNGASCQWPWGSLATEWVPVDVATTGTKTFTVEIMVDTNAHPTWNDNDITIEVMHNDTASSFHLDTLRSGPSTIIATATALAAGVGNSAWATTGLTTPVSKKIVSPVISVDRAGAAYVRVRMYKPNAVAYVDLPKVAVT